MICAVINQRYNFFLPVAKGPLDASERSVGAESYATGLSLMSTIFFSLSHCLADVANTLPTLFVGRINDRITGSAR